VAPGSNLLDIAQSNDLEMEGACGGSCACSTCHVIVEDEAYYDKMNEPDDDENDMLDLAFGLTETSRLGCQVEMRKELDGVTVRLPRLTRNLQESDFKWLKRKGMKERAIVVWRGELGLSFGRVLWEVAVSKTRDWKHGEDEDTKNENRKGVLRHTVYIS
jgi:ferredoxin